MALPDGHTAYPSNLVSNANEVLDDEVSSLHESGTITRKIFNVVKMCRDILSLSG